MFKNYKDISEQQKLDLYQKHTASQESQTDLLLESAFRSLKSLMKQRDVRSRRRLDHLSLRSLVDNTSSPFANVLPVMLVLYKNYGTQAKYVSYISLAYPIRAVKTFSSPIQTIYL